RFGHPANSRGVEVLRSWLVLDRTDSRDNRANRFISVNKGVGGSLELQATVRRMMPAGKTTLPRALCLPATRRPAIFRKRPREGYVACGRATPKDGVNGLRDGGRRQQGCVRSVGETHSTS